MKDRTVTSGSLMIQIDGRKVKYLREKQGLTQLYIATAVEVTTDTISRWENKRYPSIKNENGIKLAEALGVSLEDILDQEELEELENQRVDEKKTQAQSLLSPSQKRGLLLLLLAIATILLFIFFFKKHNKDSILAHRTIPYRTIANLPFPVVIEVKGKTQKPIALILKENLPQTASIVNTSPKVSHGGPQERHIKWIQKIHGKSRFAYMITIDNSGVNATNFSGSVAISQGNGKAITVQGNNKIELGSHHWADSDGDNVISDHEILTVYDQYSGIDDFEIDIDLIERMWLGSGYRWEPGSKSFTILP